MKALTEARENQQRSSSLFRQLISQRNDITLSLCQFSDTNTQHLERWIIYL